MLDRRGQGLPLNTIIISIIVVVVLVVIILIFTGNLGNTATTLRSCEAQGGECIDSGETCAGRVLDDATCEPDDDTCCVTIGE